jgi:hypothetical protein
MANDELKKKMPMDMYAGRKAAAEAAAAAQRDKYEDVYGDEGEEDLPEFRSLRWKKGGKEVSEAMVDEQVTLFCEVKNIADGATVTFSIFEQGERKDDPVAEVQGEVKNGNVEVPWEVIYQEDKGSNVAEELEEQGWVLPWYYFVVKYGESESHQSKVLDIKGAMDYQLLHPETGELLINHEYMLVSREGKILSGKSDENGNIKLKGFKLGDFGITGGGNYGSTS